VRPTETEGIQLISCGSAGLGERPGCSLAAPRGEFTELRHQSFEAFSLGLNSDLTAVDHEDKKSVRGTLVRGKKKRNPKRGSLKLSK